jgi:hypothetical protein
MFRSLSEVDLVESQAPRIKHKVITLEKMSAAQKKYFQLNTLTATKLRASPHLRMANRANLSAEMEPDCHAIATERRRKRQNPHKISIRAVKPLRFEVTGLLGCHQRVNLPTRIDLAETQRVAYGEKYSKAEAIL